MTAMQACRSVGWREGFRLLDAGGDIAGAMSLPFIWGIAVSAFAKATDGPGECPTGILIYQ